jgi:serine/threonine-protein kinase PknK
MTEALSFSPMPGELPAEITTFVGRRSDRVRVRELMSQARLVTLTGFGGVGKSRLALRMAIELRRLFADGVCFVELGGVSEPSRVPDEVATSLGLQGRSKQSASIAVVEYLRSRSMLLVLDNCEHVVDVAAVLADTVLKTCPQLRVLTTSREPLRIGGEAVHSLSGLSFPSTAELDGGSTHPSDAVELFLDRARAIVPDFSLNDVNRAAVAAVCHKLEGIPLALELAAARLRTLSPAELDTHLSDRWELLSKGSRTAPRRHSTMAACIEWSFDLCTPAERQLWARSAVFVDGFELDAATFVCLDPDGDEPLADTLQSLVDKSVLTATMHERANRFRMLPPIRRRGLEELTRTGHVDEIRRRHKDFYVGMVVRAHKDWFSSRQAEWMGQLRGNSGNLHNALEMCANNPGESDSGLVAGANLLEIGLVEGRFRQGGRWFDKLLSTATGEPETRARALRTASWWAAMQGDVDTSRSLLEEAQALTPRGGETETLLAQTAGFMALQNGDVVRADLLLHEAAQGFSLTGNRAELALTWMLLGLVRSLVGDTDGALGCHRECLAITEPAGETWVRSWSLWVAGQVVSAQGDLERGEDLLRQSLRLKQQLAERSGIGVLLESLALTSAISGPERAAVLMGAAQNEWDKVDTSTEVLPGLDSPHRDALGMARAALGDAAFEAAWARGRMLDQASAIAFALGESAGSAKKASGKGTHAVRGVLTRRESQIAELIHQGLSNKEIADALVISTRTAETHVEHIFTKLGLTKRTQVSAWMGDHTDRPSDAS